MQFSYVFIYIQFSLSFIFFFSVKASLESIRDSLAEELVSMTAQVRLILLLLLLLLPLLLLLSSCPFMLMDLCWLQCEKLRAESSMLPGIRAELESLRRRHSAALELMGERDEEVPIFFFFDSLLRMVNKFSPLDVVEA